VFDRICFIFDIMCSLVRVIVECLAVLVVGDPCDAAKTDGSHESSTKLIDCSIG
jgi:hypothetical protein